MQQPDKQREAFEAWWDSTFTGVPTSVEEWRVGWQAWQAAQQTQWLPIETAPKDGTVVDIWSKMYGRLTAYVRTDLGDGNVFYEQTEGGYTCVRDVTHWMPLPQGPNVVD